MIVGKCPVCGADMRIGHDMTNADRIRSMTDEELAETMYLRSCIRCFDKSYACKDDGCKKCWIEWLKAKAEVRE